MPLCLSPSKIRAALAALAVTTCALLPGLARAADGFVEAEGKVAERIPAGPFLAAAYGFIWVAVVVYVVAIGRGLSRTKVEIDELRRKVDAKL